jgi:hypothetical protein
MAVILRPKEYHADLAQENLGWKLERLARVERSRSGLRAAASFNSIVAPLRDLPSDNSGLSSPFDLFLRLANLLACDIAQHSHNIHSRSVGAHHEPPANQVR